MMENLPSSSTHTLYYFQYLKAFPLLSVLMFAYLTSSLSKMVELNESEAIDNELLELWQEKMLSKYNHEIIELPF